MGRFKLGARTPKRFRLALFVFDVNLCAVPRSWSLHGFSFPFFSLRRVESSVGAAGSSPQLAVPPGGPAGAAESLRLGLFSATHLCPGGATARPRVPCVDGGWNATA